ncbi:hypothetical protein [Burkholderia mayonis]|uniref:hypothetical protein n=1 Tax=Burkholderia mayonis TaxID=1385591 RepID=UPI000ABB0409|nr:hypothetical protein [Burkholderia mayonis]
MPNKVTGGSTTPLDNYSSASSSSSSNPQSTRRSSERPAGDASLRGLQNLGGQSTPQTRRENVTNQAATFASYPNATYYSAAVHQVSSTLQDNGLGITQGSHDSVLGNLRGIHDGTQTHTGAHLAESASFGRDAQQHLRAGEYRDGAVTAFGSAINAAASMTVGPARDFETARQHPDPQISSRATASLHNDFETLPSPKRD